MPERGMCPPAAKDGSTALGSAPAFAGAQGPTPPTLRARTGVEVDLVHQLGGALAVFGYVLQRQRVGLQRAPALHDVGRRHAGADRVLVVGRGVDLLRLVGG